MNWLPVDIIVALVVSILVLSVIGSFTLQLFAAQSMPPEEYQIWENFIISSVAIISLYVGSKLNGGDNDK